jgi:hypothetical protein
MEIIDCAQNSPEWYAARCGIVTASNLKTVLANGRGGAESKTRRSYLNRLAAEVITGEPLETFSNRHTERGHALEPEARDYYAFLHSTETKTVGFVRNGPKGCSPDSFVGDAGLLEIKTQRGDLMIETLLADQFPSEHKAQVQGQLWICEREWCDLLVYWPGLPPFIKRAYRDPGYIIQLSDAVDQFNEELSRVVERIRSYGMERAA